MSRPPRLAELDPFAPEVVENPFPFFEALRRERPVYRLEGAGYWLIARYADVRAAALDVESFSSNLVAIVMEGVTEGPQIVDLTAGAPRPADVLALADPPVHTRQRKLVNKAFSMRRTAKLEPMIRAMAVELMDGIQGESQVEWMSRVAIPLPLRLILRLTGFPQEDAARIKRWADDGVALLAGLQTPETLAERAKSVAELIVYLAEAVEAAKRSKGEGLLADLVRATQGEEEVLSEEEVVSVMVQVLSAGQETTGSLIGSAAMLLARDPWLQEVLRTTPTMIPAFIEEAVRLESPFYGHFRQVTREVEIGGVTLPQGARAMLLWSSANRDPAQFERPDQVDLNRPSPKSHLGFGVGAHMCIGAELARLEARVAIEELLGQTRSIRLAEPKAPLRHTPSLFIRCLESLPLEIDWR